MNDGDLVSWDFIDEIYMKMRKTQDDFIFSTIQPHLEKIMETKINKELLIRALKEYFKNHPEEYK